MSTSRPVSPLAITGSNTSEIDNSIDAKYDGSLNEDSIQHQLSDDEVWDLFSKVHTLHKEKESLHERRKRTRIGTMGGFVVNKTTLLKLHIDQSNYITIHIRSDTKASDAIQKIITRRNLPASTQCKLYQDNQEIDDNANLHEIMQITSGAQIQVRFIANDELKLNKDHHLIHSIITQEDDEIDLSTLSPYRISNKNNVTTTTRRRAFPNKMNLVAFNSFSVQTSDDNDVARDQVLRNIEQQLKKLPRQQYNVVKVNKHKKRQKRILKLTQYGIENIHPATSGLFNNKEETVTSFHLWENITNSYLEDSKTIRISYKDYEGGDRKYETLEANNINESIQKRLKIIRDQKTDAGRKEISIKFQKKLINQQIANNKIFNLNDHVRLTRNRSGYIVYKGFVHFAPGDHYGIELDESNGDHDGFYDGIRYFKTKSMKAVIVPESHIIRKINMKKFQQNGRKERHSTFSQNEKLKISSPFQKPFQAVDENDNIVEEKIYKQLKAMILSTETIEGKYRLNFANKFHKYVKEENLLELVRDFMDAVKDKIDEKHGEKYKQMILKSWHSNDDMKDDKKQMTETEKAEELSKLGDTMNKLFESAVAETILQSKITPIYKICLDETKEETQILQLKIDKLRRRQQAYFGIKKELESTTNWNRAVYELSLLRDCTLPSEKIKSLVNCAHGIYLGHAKEQRENEKVMGGNYGDRLKRREEFFITGDDFLPIVIYVIVQASKNGPCINDADLRFMEGLVDPATNRSEPGYYLAVFHAALQWIRCFNN
eukprot:7254_1